MFYILFSDSIPGGLGGKNGGPVKLRRRRAAGGNYRYL